MSYVPGPAQPQSLDELWRYLQAELGKIQRALATLEVVARSYHEPPRAPGSGQIVLADGTDWDPGQGRGLYAWDGAAWILVIAL